MKKNFLNKREQSQARLSYAECKKSRLKARLFSLLVLLMTAVSGAWAQDVLNLVVEGTSATIKYDGNASNNPYFGGDEWKQSEFQWDDEYSTRPTITTVTIDGSCKNFSGTSLRSLFIGFSGLTTINGLDNLNTANVQDMEYMFADCSSLTSLDLSSLNTASLTTMSNMFAYCSKLTTLDLSSWNTENVEVTSSLFFNCSELTTVDLSGWNTAKVWNTGYMFYKCSKLENIYVGDGWSTAKVTQSDDMFTDCTKLLSMNTANPATNKTNAHTGDGGYLKVKPAGDYLFTVAPCEHGSGTVKFFVDEKEVKGANEGDLVTMTVTPDEGYVVGSVSANAYTTWAGARRNAPAAIPMLGNVTLTPVEGKANTWTFTMPAASVELKVGYLATSNLYLSKEALADKASIAVTAGETTVAFDDDGKSANTVTEGSTVTTKYNGTKKILGMKAEKKAKAPAAIINGKFSVSDTKQVYFSKGNLRYASGAWSFFDNQYDYYATYSADAWDKFGWSNSTSNFGMSTSTDNNDYKGDLVDWGTVPGIGTGWFTLSNDEWGYLFNTRSASTVNSVADARYAKGKVNGVYGIILFPDTYTHPAGVTLPVGINQVGNAGWNGNIYSAADWTAMETAGCVFLPATGYREGTSVLGAGESCSYRSSSRHNEVNVIYVFFTDIYLNANTKNYGYYGQCVRLVQDVK